MVAIVGAMGLVLPAHATGSSPSTPYTDIPLQETGQVVEAVDGDTLKFVEDGTSTVEKIRLLGVNTPEVMGFNNSHFDSNMCGGIDAWHQLQRILPSGTRVQLRAASHESSNRGRALRYVFAYDEATGQFDVDVQAEIARSGLAMWFALDAEAAMSYPYRTLIDDAQAAHAGIWDPSYCGPVEQPDAQLSVVVNWDAPGVDNENLNGEFVVVRNTGQTSVDVSGWLLRDSSLTSWYHVPDGTVIAPADYRIVHVGSGTPGSPDTHDLYIDSEEPLFPNTSESSFLGDGAYLLDRNTAVRFYQEYPCVSDCTDGLKGRVVITQVNAKSRAESPAARANQEFVVIKNVGSTPALLDGYYLRRTASTYPFMANTWLNPGASLTVRIGRGTADDETQYWGQPSTLLDDAHDCVSLLSNEDVKISEVHWTKPSASGLHQ